MTSPSTASTEKRDAVFQALVIGSFTFSSM
jgi:hypothetical protein